MTSEKRIKVIFDTNVWISFFIGKKLQFLEPYISNKKIILVLADELMAEVKDVLSRPKLKKYFAGKDLAPFLNYIGAIAEFYTIEFQYVFAPDPKDSFLFDLIDSSDADFLVTGDRAILEKGTYKNAAILSPDSFEKRIATLFPSEHFE